jgi:hypothetical protein
MRTDLRYSASDCFDTFPFPTADRLASDGSLEGTGTRIYETRAKLMIDRSQGLTDIYNQLKDPRCDDPAIVTLRQLHEDMDRAVLAAYVWSDLSVPPYQSPTTDPERKALESFEDEIIDRLFTLNAERAEQERLRGATVKAVPKARGQKPPKADAQLELAPVRRRPP